MLERFADRLTGKAPKGAKRSSQWRRVRAAYIAEHPACEACGGTKRLEVHHVIAFYLAPELELYPDNLITLCRKSNAISGLPCHRLFGHLGRWKVVNESVAADAAYWRAKLSA